MIDVNFLDDTNVLENLKVYSPYKLDFYLIAFSELFNNYLNIDYEMLGFENKLVSETVVGLDQDYYSYLIRMTELLKEENEKHPAGSKDRMSVKLVEALLYFIIRDFK